MKKQTLLVCALLLFASCSSFVVGQTNADNNSGDDASNSDFRLPFPFIYMGPNPGFTLPFPFPFFIPFPPFPQFPPIPQPPPFQLPPFFHFQPFPDPFVQAPPTNPSNPTPSTPKQTPPPPPPPPPNKPSPVPVPPSNPTPTPAKPSPTSPSGGGDSPVVNSGGGGGYSNGKADSWWYRVHANGDVETSDGFYDDPNVPDGIKQMVTNLSTYLKTHPHP